MKKYTAPNVDMGLVSAADVLTTSITFKSTAGFGDELFDMDSLGK